MVYNIVKCVLTLYVVAMDVDRGSITRTGRCSVIDDVIVVVVTVVVVVVLLGMLHVGCGCVGGVGGGSVAHRPKRSHEPTWGSDRPGRVSQVTEG